MGQPRTVIVAAAVITRQDGRVLLTKRLDGAHLGGMWEFPGGKVEAGEDPEEAVVRECREECGVELIVTDIVDVTFHRFSEDKHVLLLFYDCSMREPTEVRDLQVAAHEWVSPEDLALYELPAPDAKLLRKLVARTHRAR